MARMTDPHVTAFINSLFSEEHSLHPALNDDFFSFIHRLAKHILTSESNASIEPEELVNEAFLDMLQQKEPFQNRSHFFSSLARAMRQSLITQARQRNAAKRGGNHHQITLNEAVLGFSANISLLALEEALNKLAAASRRQAEIVQFRAFLGLTIQETADIMQLSPSTIEREWRFARAFLANLLFSSPSSPPVRRHEA